MRAEGKRCTRVRPLYLRRLAQLEAACFAAGIETLALAVYLGSSAVAQIGAAFLLVVLAGEATLEAEGESRRLKVGDAAFVAVGKEHHFVDYERISLLVIFTRGG